MTTRTPLLKTGTFGVHTIETSGIWSFTGEVPRDIKRGPYPSEQAAIEAFAEWFTAQDDPFQRENIDRLRDDVIQAIFYPLIPTDPMNYTIEMQAFTGAWCALTYLGLFDDKAVAEKQMAQMNGLLVNGQPRTKYRITANRA